METALRRYMAGRAVLEDFVMQEAEYGVLWAQAPVLREVLGMISALVDRLTAAVSSAYVLERKCVDEAVEIEEGSAAQHASKRPSARVHVQSDAHTRSDAATEPGATQPVTGAQRARIIEAITHVVAERGCAGASVGLIVERARVSRATFYEMFPDGLDAGVIAVTNLGLERVGTAAAQAFESQDCWRDGMRAALAAVLVVFDSDPDLARVCMVQTLTGSPAVLEHRAYVVRAFRILVVARIDTGLFNFSPLAPEGVLASVMEIVRSRLTETNSQPLIRLLGPLMGLVVEHVEGPDEAAKETQRSERLARAIQAGGVDSVLTARTRTPREIVLPTSITNPTAHRLRACVIFLATHPGISNRAVGAALNIPHKSQVSKLLYQLETNSIAVKRSDRPGTPNAWRLTPRGEEVASALIEAVGDR